MRLGRIALFLYGTVFMTVGGIMLPITNSHASMIGIIVGVSMATIAYVGAEYQKQ